MSMHVYRTHTCGELRPEHVGQTVRLSGWVHRKRDHGKLLFIDLRDHYGLTQWWSTSRSPVFETAEAVRTESVITVTGKVVARDAATVNPRLATGEVELEAADMVVQSTAEPLPIQVDGENDRRPRRCGCATASSTCARQAAQEHHAARQVIASLRRRMIEQGFTEFQTPILTASAPRARATTWCRAALHPGKFYALPQAPQQFKQLLMVAGFDRYFQIAPCFRDEDARADRSPGEFYQLDLEMSFVTQEDVFAAIEPVLHGVFEEFAGFDREAAQGDAERRSRASPIAEAMLTLRHRQARPAQPARASPTSPRSSRGSDFKVFAGIVAAGGVVRAIPAPEAAGQPRSFFDKLNDWAQGEGAGPRLHRASRAAPARARSPSSSTDERRGKLKALTGAERRRRRVLRRRQAEAAREVRRPGAHQGRRRSWA